MTRTRVLCLVLITTFLACGTPSREEALLQKYATQTLTAEAYLASEPASQQVVSSEDGVVVSQAPLATWVGVQILGRGGNAVDAAVATAFALAVVEPTNSGIGGRTQILIRHPDGTVAALDGTSQVPEAYPVDIVEGADRKYGYGMVGIPGTVAALTTALERHGSMPLETVIAPSVALAERGFPLSTDEATTLARVADDLQLNEGASHYFLRPNGTPHEAGDRLVQTDLAATLRAIGTGGADVFYRGEIAERMVADIEANGGYLRLSDLADYRVRDALVAQNTYRGHTLIGTYLPAAGANVQAMLKILEIATPTPQEDGATWAAAIAQVLLIGFKDRLTDLADMGPPETFPRAERLDWLLSADRLRSRASSIQLTERMSFPSLRRARRDRLPERHTSHVSVVDREGRAVALTQSLGPSMGARVATRGLGFIHAATMGYLSGRGEKSGLQSLRPGDRAPSRQAPTVVLSPEGKVEMVLGASGSRHIVSAVVQIVSHTLDHGMPFAAAVASPRVHVDPGIGKYGIVFVERGDRVFMPQIVVHGLARLGFLVARKESLGQVSAIHVDPTTGIATGVADPRKGGTAGSPTLP